MTKDLEKRLRKRGVQIPARITPEMATSIMVGLGGFPTKRKKRDEYRRCTDCGKRLSFYNSASQCFVCLRKAGG
jgi:ribosomal protein S14